ncbi:MAG TPA: cupin domain-containing protein [Polyangiaceae bacterium]
MAFQAGDIAVLPRGDAHELSNGRVTELIDSSELLPKLFEGAVVSERGGGGGRITKFICGYVGCDRQAERSFLAGLPLFIETLRRYMVELPRRRTGWLAAARDSAVGRALGPRDARGSG